MHLNLYAKLDGVQSLTRKQIDSFLANAPDKYKVYSIPKRSGGERIIAHPAKRLKQFQYHIVDIMEEICEIHPCAMAYTKGKSIKENAFSHAHNQYILKLDFSDFFNSITPEMLFKALTDNNLNFTKAEERVLSKSLFWNKSKTVNSRLALSVGAPSSPLISNIVMYSFDAFFANFCKKHGIHFTRYADDLTFSTNIKCILFKIPDIVRKYLNEYYKNSITLNERKTVFTSKAHNRRVTGITITPLGTLSLGRERKRLISVLIHKYTLGILESDTLSYLQGMLAFAFHIEPAFYESMKRKYSSETILNLMPIRKKNVESTS